MRTYTHKPCVRCDSRTEHEVVKGRYLCVPCNEPTTVEIMKELKEIKAMLKAITPTGDE